MERSGSARLFERQRVLRNLMRSLDYARDDVERSPCHLDQRGEIRHIRNIYKEEELDEKSTYAKFAYMGHDGNPNSATAK